MACGRTGATLCRRCAGDLVPGGSRAVPGIDACAALLVYEGVGRDVVTGLKSANVRGLFDRVGRALAALLPDERSVDVVTAVPASGGRRRGYDQGRRLARRVARELGVPSADLLARRGGGAQMGRGRRDRLVGPRLAPRGPAPAAVLIVDDVVTTGGSLAAAARALRSAGATVVLAVVVASAERGVDRPARLPMVSGGRAGP